MIGAGDHVLQRAPARLDKLGAAMAADIVQRPHRAILAAHQQLITLRQHLADDALHIIDLVFFLRRPVDLIFPIAVHAHVDIKDHHF